MPRPDRQAPEPQLGQQLAHRALVQAHPELAPDPRLQVAAAPAHHAVARQLRPLLDPAVHRGLLLGREPRRGAGGAAVRQPGDPLGVVAVHPVAERLPVHAARLGRVLARTPVQHQRDRQHPPRRVRVPAAGRLAPQVSGRQPFSRDRHRHSQPPASSAGNSESRPPRRQDHMRVSGQGGWY
ncbi:MAG: hypothetical protein AVDCRST_MAG40-262 [uncultured Gemmatimonadaceae bacterium]|uniref:Uncharacterized protein n=1 Tax=uncultured Gemmatimonadaceae bacterium TaxID=246130 RepID=A0A6J4K9X7_9BACT|nr:MAG: hypothetical protein AVDCRST_MAG40-262 [uncultured Gemmatimonadaceae bacterium]